MSYTLNASATPIFIQRFAEDQIKPRLSSVQGIYRIDVSGQPLWNGAWNTIAASYGIWGSR